MGNRFTSTKQWLHHHKGARIGHHSSSFSSTKFSRNSSNSCTNGGRTRKTKHRHRKKQQHFRVVDVRVVEEVIVESSSDASTQIEDEEEEEDDEEEGMDVNESDKKVAIPLQKDPRILEAEKILEEIAKEYTVKRAAGLVPTIPVPARTLLWEEMARKEKTHLGRRGQCIFGRDTGTICGCTSYKKELFPNGQENPGGICACCNHGAPWHRLAGGENLHIRDSHHSSLRSFVQQQQQQQQQQCQSTTKNKFHSSYSEYYSEEDDDEEEEDDEEAIALEMARPNTMIKSNGNSTFTGIMMTSNEHCRLFSSTTNRLEILLKAINHYRTLGLSEDEIEAKIQQEFPVS
jgi:hypothetical protein